MLGGWVDDALLDLLDNLDDYTGVGFTEDDTDDLRARLEELAASAETDEPAEVFEDNTKKTPPLKEYANQDRKSVVTGKSVSVSVDLGGRRHIKKKKNNVE